MLRWIKPWIRPSSHQGGFSLVEAMIATAIMGIGFTGVYSMVMLAETSMRDAVAKQQLQMVANQIMEVIESDLDNIAQYNLDFSACTALGAGDTATYQVRGYEWCRRLSGQLGAAQANDTRTVTITALDDGGNSVQVLLTTRNGSVQIIMERVFNE